MTHAGVLHHFGSKANLLLAVWIGASTAATGRSCRSTSTARTSRDLWDRYPDVSQGERREMGLAQLFVVLIGESITPSNVGHEYLQDRYRFVRGRTQAILESSQRDGEIAAEVNCGATASQIVAFMDGALIQWLVDPQPGLLVESYRHFVDRLKDAIRRRGENISSFEVESEVLAYPAMREAAAVAVRSEIAEDEVMVVVAVREGEAFDPADLIEFLRPRMAHFMVPRFVRIVEALPRTPTAKIEKVKLRNEGLTSDTWDRESVGIVVKREKIGQARN